MIFVTGGTGFVGSYVLKELLSHGYAVRAIRRSAELPFYLPASLLQQVEWVSGDILDVSALAEQMEGADAVIHCAAKVSFNKKDRHAIFKNNIEGSANVVNAAIEHGIGRFLYVSSVAALGHQQTAESIDEKQEWAQNRFETNYSVSKYYAELEVWRGMAEGLAPVIVNPSTVLGYGDWTKSSIRIFKSVYDGFPWYTRGKTGFVDVEDVARAIVQLLPTEISNERFILNADNWTYQQLFNCIADGFSVRRPYREATPFLAGTAWRMESIKSSFSGKDPLLTKETAAGARNKIQYENGKIRRALAGFEFSSLEKTIQRACDAYKAHLSTKQNT